MNNFYSVSVEDYKYNYNSYESSDQYAEHILTQAKINKDSIHIDREDFLLVTTLVWERHWLDDIQLYKNLFDSFKRKKIKTILILDSYYVGKDVDCLSTKVYYVDFFLWRTYDKVIRQEKSKVNPSWNSNADKFLILNGKPAGENRIRLLWKLRNYMSDAIWSLHVHEGARDQCRSFIPELDDKGFDAFVKKYNNNPDQAKIVFQDRTSHYGGIPYDEKMFSSSLFRVITETFFEVHDEVVPWLTEKTFITILNNLPFIMAGDNFSLSKLTSMGFRTFEKYLPVKDYDLINDCEKKLDAVVTNTAYWLKSMRNKEAIAEDVKHNHKKLLTIARENLKRLENICQENGINPSLMDKICSTRDNIGQI